jgi:hypothetical protein
MNKRCFGVFGLLFLILSSLHLKCGDLEPSGDSGDKADAVLATFIRLWEHNLSKINSISYSATSTYKVEPEFEKQAGDLGDTTCTYSFLAQGDKWVYDVDVKGKSGLLITSRKEAFDGTTIQEFSKRDGLLTLIKSRAKTEVILATKTYIFNPILFVPQERLQTVNYPLTLSSFKLLANWESISKRVSDVDFVNIGQETSGISFLIPGGFDPHSKKDFKYKVSLSNTWHDYPISWSMLDEKGNLLEDYSVDKLGVAPIAGFSIAFQYPLAATRKMYLNGKLVGSGHAVIDSVKINANVDPDAFTIDPSEAKLIRDVDAGTTVEVPQ